MDKVKARHYHELAAIGGCATSRNKLGVFEACVGNGDKAIKHWLIACEFGNAKTLNNIKAYKRKLPGATKAVYGTTTHIVT